MLKRTIAACVLLCTPAFAADPAPKPPTEKTHALVLTDSELALIGWLAERAGQGCDMSAEGQQHCAAQVQAVQMMNHIKQQLAAPLVK